MLTLFLAEGSSAKPVCCFSSLYVVPSPSSCFDSLSNGCLSSCLSALFFWAGVDSIRTDTVTAQRPLAYSVGWRAARPAASVWLKPGQRLDWGFALSHSPLNKPCILCRGVCMRMRTKWGSNRAGNVFGVWEQQKLGAYYRLLFSHCKFAASPSSSSVFKNVRILQDSCLTVLYSEVM